VRRTLREGAAELKRIAHHSRARFSASFPATGTMTVTVTARVEHRRIVVARGHVRREGAGYAPITVRVTHGGQRAFTGCTQSFGASPRRRITNTARFEAGGQTRATAKDAQYAICHRH
jgi:hypothetical protein